MILRVLHFVFDYLLLSLDITISFLHLLLDGIWLRFHLFEHNCFQFSMKFLNFSHRYLMHHGRWWVQLLHRWANSFLLCSCSRAIRVFLAKGAKLPPCLPLIQNLFYHILCSLHFFLDQRNQSLIRRYLFSLSGDDIEVKIFSSKFIEAPMEAHGKTFVITSLLIFSPSMLFNTYQSGDKYITSLADHISSFCCHSNCCNIIRWFSSCSECTDFW